jgi:hypothetical protein
MQENTHFSTERGMRIINYVVFLCIREYQQLNIKTPMFTTNIIILLH